LVIAAGMGSGAGAHPAVNARTIPHVVHGVTRGRPDPALHDKRDNKDIMVNLVGIPGARVGTECCESEMKFKFD
jgi:hypothetical protein